MPKRFGSDDVTITSNNAKKCFLAYFWGGGSGRFKNWATSGYPIDSKFVLTIVSKLNSRSGKTGDKALAILIRHQKN